MAEKNLHLVFHELCDEGNINGIDLFLKNNSAHWNINQAVSISFGDNCHEITKHILENYNIDIYQKNELLIRETCFYKVNDFAKYLLSSPKLKINANPMTAFHSSCRSENEEMIEYIISKASAELKKEIEKHINGEFSSPAYTYAQKIMKSVNLSNELHNKLNSNEAKPIKRKI